jgi:NTE family protein
VLERTNRLVTVLNSTLEPHEKERVDQMLTDTRGAPYEVLDTLSFAPSQDIGAIAGSHLRSHMRKWDLGRVSEWLFGRAARAQASWEADLASYLLFDGTFADALIQLGRLDAMERAAEIETFFSQ